MLPRFAWFAGLALLLLASGPAAAWHVSVEFCLTPCSTPSVVTTPEAPWLLPFHPPSPCVGAAGLLACAVFP